MATLTVTHTSMESRTSDDSTWRDRSADYAGTYSSTRYKYSSSAFNFTGTASKIVFTLPYNDNSSTSFQTSLYVGPTSIGAVSTIPSNATKIGTFPATIGDSTASGTLTLTITNASTINTFLNAIATNPCIYIYGSNNTTGQTIECKSTFSITITYSTTTMYVYSGGWKAVTPYVYTSSGWKEATPSVYSGGWGQKKAFL